MGLLLVSHDLATNARRESPPQPLCLSIRRIISRAEAGGGGRREGVGKARPPGSGAPPRFCSLQLSGKLLPGPRDPRQPTSSRAGDFKRGQRGPSTRGSSLTAAWRWPPQPPTPSPPLCPDRPASLGRPRASLSGLSSAIPPKPGAKVGRLSEVSSAPDQSARPRSPSNRSPGLARPPSPKDPRGQAGGTSERHC